MRRLHGIGICCAGLCGFLLLPGPGSRDARAADWQVHRRDGGDAVDAAWRLVVAAPQDPSTAQRVLRHLGSRERRQLIDRARAISLRLPGRYEEIVGAAALTLASGHAAGAVDLYARAVNLRPAACEAHAGLGHALARAERPGDAVAAFERALERCGEADVNATGAVRRAFRAQVRDGLAAAAFANHDPDRAVNARRAAAAEAPGDPALVETLADALARAGRPADAAEAIDGLLERRVSGRAPAAKRAVGAETTRLLLLAVDLHRRAGDDERGFGLLWGALHEDPSLWSESAPSSRSAILTALESSARRARRLFDLERWLSEKANQGAGGAGDGPARVALARTREALGDFPGALAAAEKHLSLAPRATAAAELAFRVARKAGQPQKALDLRDARADQFAPDVSAMIVAIEARLREPAPRDAAVPDGPPPDETLDDRFRVGLRRFRRDPAALAQLADAAASWGRDEWSLSAWDALVRLNPDSTRALTAIGEIHFQHGRRDLARRSWARLARTIQPAARAHAELASIYLEHDDLDEAFRHARRAASLQPGSLDALRVTAEINERKKQWGAAAEIWRAILRAAPTARSAHASPDSSTDRSADRSIERREARNRLLSLLSRQGPRELLAEAAPLREQLAKNLLDVESTLTLAEIELQLRQTDRAVETLRHTARRFPDDRRLAAALTSLLRNREPIPIVIGGGDQAAEDHLESFVKRNPGNARWALSELAEISAERGQWDRAHALARQAAVAGPGDEPAWLRVSELAERAVRTESGEADPSFDGAHRALAIGHSPRAIIANARLLLRRGRLAEASALLRSHAARARTEIAADFLSIDVGPSEIAGDLAGLERLTADLDSEGLPELRNLHIELLARLVPGLYLRGRVDPEAVAALAQMSQLGLAPLLERVARTPDIVSITLLGMFGRREAVPTLVGILHANADGPARRNGRPRRMRDTRNVERSYQAESALLALGRIGDLRASPDIIAAIGSGGTPIRLAGLWALGHLRSAGDDPDGAANGNPEQITALLSMAADDRTRVDESALACLMLARRNPRGSADHLATLVRDGARDGLVRRAAALGLGAGPATPAIVEALADALDSDVPGLPEAAAAALAARGGDDAFAALWRHVLDADPDRAERAVRALAVLGHAIPDDDAGIELPIRVDRMLAARTTLIDVDASLAGLAASGGRSGRARALDTVAERPRLARAVLEQTLSEPGDGRSIRALRAVLALLAARAKVAEIDRAGVQAGPPGDEPLAGVFGPTLLAALRSPAGATRGPDAAAIPALRWLALAALNLVPGPAPGAADLISLLSDIPVSGFAFEDLASELSTAAARIPAGAQTAVLLAGLRGVHARGTAAPPRARALSVRLMASRAIRRAAAGDLERALRDPDPLVRYEAGRHRRAY